MSLKFMEGFDQFDGEQDLPALLITAGYTASGSLAITDGRNAATKALRIGDDTNGGNFGRTFASAQQIVCFGFAYRAAAERSAIMQITDVLTLAWDVATGKISINGNAGAATIVLAVWYYFEIVVDKTLGEIRVYINNELDLTVALPGGAAFITTFVCAWTSPGDSKQVDDLVFVDAATGAYTNRMGPVQITARTPSIDVDAEWAAATGSDRFEMVNNVPVVPADFIQSNTSNAYSTFLSDTTVADPDNILAVGLVVRARKSDVDNRQLGLVVGTKAGPNKEVLQPTLQITDTYSYAIFETDPGNVAWDDISVSDTAFGVVVRP